jgi:hypothetical protein
MFVEDIKIQEAYSYIHLYEELTKIALKEFKLFLVF